MNEKKSKHAYTELLEHFSDEEMLTISQLKRFFEWMEGDPEFATAVMQNQLSQEQLDRLKAIGVLFDLKELSLIWEVPEIFVKYSLMLNCTCSDYEIDAESVERVKQYPLLSLWFKYSFYKKNLYLQSRKIIYRVPKNKKFDAWRLRRIASSRSELGLFGYHIDHPVFAFELGDGCSVGCWFCAFATKKLTKNFDYGENREYFSEIVHKCVDMFGKNPTAMALLYYGTEPHDNPDYINFIKDYHKITGHPVCTSTAVGTDAPWLRELIAYYREGGHPWPRLSVLSRKMLYKIHDLYEPHELRDVSLLMQMKDMKRCKVTGGRILEEQNGLKEREADHYLDSIVPQGSIACVSGFLVNMVRKTIELISPCYTSRQWPYGYRVFDEASFEDASGFQQAVETLIERNMPEHPFPEAKARFRDDLSYRQTETGFDLISPNQVHHFNGEAMYRDIGNLLAKGDMTYRELSDYLIDEKKYNPLVISTIVKQMFDSGLLNEIFHTMQSEDAGK